MRLTTIDLFAGCGGLSLGLESAGFETVFVNELHPVALSTFLANRRESSLFESSNHCHDIFDLTRNGHQLEAFASRLRSTIGEIDLVVGGPPCQGFSGIGHRRSFDITKESIPSNHLYREMAKVVQAAAPRAFVFENVKGLLNSRWNPNGEAGEIWRDVQRTFRRIRIKRGRTVLEYSIESALLLAKDYGVPQNRPRIIMIGIRTDIAPSKVSSGVANGYLPDPTNDPPDLIDLLGDIVDPDWSPGGATPHYPRNAETRFQASMRRTPSGHVLELGSPLTDHEYSAHSPHIVAKFQHMLDNGGAIPDHMKTKKFAQRVLPTRWGPGGPSITATSLPDDYVHFSQPRVPTVREWARLQTFPDWYQFEGRRTTGGRRRAGDPDQGNWSRDLPKFTQIGNAVPPLLAYKIGMHLRRILDR